MILALVYVDAAHLLEQDGRRTAVCRREGKSLSLVSVRYPLTIPGESVSGNGIVQSGAQAEVRISNVNLGLNSM